jgi:predicted nucleic acid-binding protein
MVSFYFDTSAIVKRYHGEAGSRVVDSIFELHGFDLVTSYWSVLEFVVAFSFKVRRGELSRETFNVVVSRFLRDVLDGFTITGVDDELVARATPLAVKYALPSSDCLQLASVVAVSTTLEQAGEKLVLVSSDRDLCRAAEGEGIQTLDPEDGGASEALSSFVAGRREP